MAEDPDLERRLEAMFASARPRPGFDDQLWKQLQAQRPWPRRVLDWLLVPAHLAPALAALVAVAGVGWLATGIHPGSGATTASSGAAPYRTAPGFGVLPALKTSAKSSVNGSGAAFGPAVPVPGVTGAPDLAQEAPSELPVYRFDEPSPSELAATVTALTDRSGLSIKVLAGDPAAGQPPRFQVTGLNVPVGPEGQVAAAQSFLGAHALLPTYTYGVISSPDRVVYNRRFGDPAGSIPEVGLDGRAVGLEVDFSGGSLVAVTGPLELAVANSPYPLRVFSTTPAAATGESQGQAVRLVYVLVVAGGHGYYEPELLVFSSAGFEFQPVIAPQYLSRT